MGPFECEGIWWLPDNPSEQVAGTLSIDADGCATLCFIGTLGPPDKVFSEAKYSIILGRALESPLGNVITLRDCWLTKRSIGMPGFTRETYHVDRCFFGAHLTRDGDFLFSRASARFSGLDSWADVLRGLNQEPVSSPSNGPLLSITYTPPASISGEIPGAKITLGASARASHSWRRGTIEEHVYIDLTLDELLTEEEIQSRYIYQLQNLFTLATDHPNALTSMRVKPSDVSPLGARADIHVVASRVFADDKAVSEMGPHNVLFSLGDIPGRFVALARRWFEITKRHQAACSLFFGIQYTPGTFLDLKFQILVQALSLYYGLGDWIEPRLKSVLQHLNDEDRQWLVERLAEHPLTAADASLRGLLKKHEATMEPLVGDTSPFASTVLRTLRYVYSRDPTVGSVPKSDSLYWLTQRLMFLMKVCFLDDLGFSATEQRKLLQRNKLYQHMCQLRDSSSGA